MKNLENFKLNNTELNELRGGLFGRKRQVLSEDVNRDGKLDRVVNVYDKFGNLIKTKVVYGD